MPTPGEKAQRRPRILFYNHTRQASGAERVLLNMLTVLDRERYTVAVACPMEGPGTLDEQIKAQGREVVAAPLLAARFTSSPVRLAGYLRSFAQAIFRFRRLVQGFGPDLLHANSVRAGIVATLATAGLGTRVLWHIHDDLPPHPISQVIRLLARASRRTSFVAVSHATARVFGRDLGERMHVLHNGIDLTRYPAKTAPLDAAAAAVRTEFGTGMDERLVVSVGMINPRKGLAELITAMVHQGKARLVLVGAAIFNEDHRHEAALRTMIQELGLRDRVYLTGARSDVPAILRAADLFVLNSTVEPFGLVLVEAMASETPVLARAVGGISEIVEDGVTGRLRKSDELLDLGGEAIQAAMMARRALAETVPRFSLQVFASGLDQLYRNLLKL